MTRSLFAQAFSATACSTSTVTVLPLVSSQARAGDHQSGHSGIRTGSPGGMPFCRQLSALALAIFVLANWP